MKSPARISLLDDYPSILKATARLLCSAGWHADTFTDPHAFLSHAEENTPALAVLDIHMPLMDGLRSAVAPARSSPGTRVIFLASADSPVIRAHAMRAGASAYFLKPTPSAEFLDAIKAALAQRQCAP